LDARAAHSHDRPDQHLPAKDDPIRKETTAVETDALKEALWIIEDQAGRLAWRLSPNSPTDKFVSDPR
jgi:hypothetical protein